MSDLSSQLSAAAALPQKDKVTAYVSLLSSLLSSTPAPALPASLASYIEHVVHSDAVGLVIARQVLGEVVRAVAGKQGALGEGTVRREVIERALETLQPRVVSFEEQAGALRECLSDIQQEEEEWTEAARTLMGIPLESGHRSVSDAYKLSIYNRIVRLLLQDEDAVQAEAYLNRMAVLMHTTSDREIQLGFKLSQARVMDYKRRFEQAAQRYQELSWAGELDEGERLQALGAAATCAILAPAGPHRSRILASLYRDERSSQLPNAGILRKMFLDHILRPREIAAFEATLLPHQLARVAESSNDVAAVDVSDLGEGAEEGGEQVSKRTGPTTVLDRAVMEHNLLSASKIYLNITLPGLGALLDLHPSAAETIARRMIAQGRLRATVDQIAGLITFDPAVDAHDALGGAAGVAAPAGEEDDGGRAYDTADAPRTERWDEQIRRTAASVEAIALMIEQKELMPPQQQAAVPAAALGAA